MRQLGRTFLRGLIAILPIGATLFVIFWLAGNFETLFATPIKWLLPDGPDGKEQYYIPGTGILVGFLLIFGLGVLLDAFLVKRMLSWGESLLERLPLAKTVLNATKDMMGLFSSDPQKKASQVVTIRMGEGPREMKLIGLVTRSDLTDLPGSVGGEDRVAVYLPMSYQIGGYMVMVPRSALEPVNMDMEDALRFVLTAGAKSEQPAGEKK